MAERRTAASASRSCRRSIGRIGRRTESKPLGRLARGADRRHYFAGDSGYFPGFAEIGRRFAPLDVALLPIGAYEPRWFMRYQHLNPAEAYQAFRDLRARHMIGVHWGTFDLTDEPPSHGPRVLEPLLSESERAVVHMPRIGGRIEY